MILNKRQTEIIKLLEKSNYIRVSDLSKHFNVTPTSIRRDLSLLEKDGFLQRSHGYAILNATPDVQEISERSSVNPVEKKRIAEAAMKFVLQRESVILDSGTTIYALAELISASSTKNISVVTNSIDTARCIAYNQNCLVTLTGGVLQPRNMSLVGPDAEYIFTHTVADTAFIGATGIVPGLGLTASSPFHVSIKKKMINASGRVIVLCDSSKLISTGTNVFSTFDKVTSIVTVQTPENAHVVRSLEKHGVNIVLA